MIHHIVIIIIDRFVVLHMWLLLNRGAVDIDMHFLLDKYLSGLDSLIYYEALAGSSVCALALGDWIGVTDFVICWPGTCCSLEGNWKLLEKRCICFHGFLRLGRHQYCQKKVGESVFPLSVCFISSWCGRDQARSMVNGHNGKCLYIAGISNGVG